MSKKLRIAVIGTGLAWERLHFPAMRQMADQYEIAAMSDVNAPRMKKNAKLAGVPEDCLYTDYRQMLQRDDIDAVDVLVPIASNFEVGKAVIESGRHLIAEKPFADTPERAEALIALKNRHRVRVMVAENYRYDECSLKIKEILERGELGELLYFVQITGADFEKQMLKDTFAATEWRQHPDYPGGVFLDSGVHDIARLQYLFGDIEQVSGNGKEQEKDYCPYAMLHAVLTHASGLQGIYLFSSQMAELHRSPVGLRIYGTKGELYLRNKECGVIKLCFADGTKRTVDFAAGKGYLNELENFYHAVCGNSAIKEAPELELKDIQVVHGILSSIRQKTSVMIPTF